MMATALAEVATIVILFGWVTGTIQPSECDVTAKTESGYVCGRRRLATNGDYYASFRGIPYAKQPLGKLRFQELQPPEPFHGIFDAREAGPICPQVDVIYGPLLQPRSMGEDCIRINVHVPIQALPDGSQKPLLPILAWVHGGSFSYGSGDADLQGPEYLMTKGIILVTFNYRLNALGYLSLNSKSIPGNNGLRDARTALVWLQRNARFFGGDPGNVTIGGQSAGGVMAHILSISPACKRLYNKVMALSGTAIANFVAVSPLYSALMAKIFLLYMGLNILEDPEIIHQQLISAPMSRILDANRFLLDQFGLVSFCPVIETPTENFTAILLKDPEYLLDEGRGKNSPLLLGYTNNESQTYKARLRSVNLEAKTKLLPPLIVPTNLLFSSNPLTVPILTLNILNEYFNNSIITLDTFADVVTDSFYKYPVYRIVEKRIKTRAAPTYYYDFSYHGIRSIVKEVMREDFPGAGHLEDITYFFRVNSFQGPMVVNELRQDDLDSMMREFMTRLISDFVITGDPTPLEEDYGLPKWPEAGKRLRHESIEVPMLYNAKTPSPYLKAKKRFYDIQYKLGRGL
ncbi:juvenile hormone esterase-like [Ostrinia furnacalis]|uniref:juvenile hormone esterase-like n=1 Tax=Ostrinia furnacalis TaxID=93504 RepID=UPI0010386D0B|nr:juvenile hormone esterase-like [Ostrinia furnacalis]